MSSTIQSCWHTNYIKTQPPADTPANNPAQKVDWQCPLHRFKYYPSHNVSLTHYRLSQVLADGSTCLVYKLETDHPKHKAKVLKLFTTAYCPPGYETTYHEGFIKDGQLTNWLHSHLPRYGDPKKWITLPPRVKLSTKLEGRSAQVVKLCDGDLLTFLDTLTWQERLSCLKQLVDTLHYYHRVHGLVHGDIKTENVLVYTNKLGNKCFALSDLGSAIYNRNADDASKNEFSIVTLEWSCPNDQAYARSYQTHRSWESLQQLRCARDVFCLGAVLKALFLQSVATAEGAVDQTPLRPDSHIEGMPLPPPLIQLINGMLDPHWFRRPTIDTVTMMVDTLLFGPPTAGDTPTTHT